MARKRQHCEIDNLESVKEPLYSVSLDGVDTDLSAVKKGKNSSFFDGSISDGTMKMRIVGFRAGQHKIMNAHLMKKLPIRLEECQIRKGEKTEIQLNDKTALKKSSKMFDVSSLKFDIAQTPPL